jgi:hypothetical protein
MLKDFPPVQEWMEESRLEGERQGGLKQLLPVCKRTLAARFGLISPAAEEFLELPTADELGDLIVRSIDAPDLASLGIPE